MRVEVALFFPLGKKLPQIVLLQGKPVFFCYFCIVYVNDVHLRKRAYSITINK